MKYKVSFVTMKLQIKYLKVMILGRTFYLEQLLIYPALRGLYIAGDERSSQYRSTIPYPKLFGSNMFRNPDFFLSDFRKVILCLHRTLHDFPRPVWGGTP